jgi:thioredoxin-related protein
MKILKFYSDTCIPCRLLSRTMEANTPDNFNIIPINVSSEEGRVEAQSYNVKSVPTLIALDLTGEEVARLKGNVTNKEYVEFLEKALEE